MEHFYVDGPSTSLSEGTASLVPDPLNYRWRDYGPRVGRVMALALHPFVIGQPFRHKYLDQALGYIANHPGVSG